jgi:hypothetical protein
MRCLPRLAHLWLLGACLASGPALAASTTWQVALTQEGPGPVTAVAQAPLQEGAGKANALNPGGTFLEVTCTPATLCEGVALKVFQLVQGQPQSVPVPGPASPAPHRRTFALPAQLTDLGRLELQVGGTSVFTAGLMPAPAGGPQAGTGTGSGAGAGARTEPPQVTTSVSVADLIRQPCAEVPVTLRPYSTVEDRAELVVRLNGNVLSELPRSIDEDDTVVVHVLVPPGLQPYVKVRRTSALRTVVGSRIVGGEETLPGLQRQAAELESCAVVSAEVRDFAPGRGEITVSVETGTASVVTGTVEFTVNPLYTGMFSLGPSWSALLDPGFQLVNRRTEAGATEAILSRTEQGEGRLLYALFYTPFVWKKRDIEKTDRPFYHSINPTLGVVLNDPLDNALFGLSADFFNGFVVTGGVHVGHVTHIDPRSGLSLGSRFEGEAGSIPTTRSWEARGFIAVSVDLRAAVQLLQSAVGLRSTPLQ